MHHEAVADAAHGLHEQRIGGIVLDLAAQTVDLNVDRALARRGAVAGQGEALAVRLAGLQSARIGRALASLGYGDHDMARRFLIAMLDPGQRAGVLRLIDGADPTRRRTL